MEGEGRKAGLGLRAEGLRGNPASRRGKPGAARTIHQRPMVTYLVLPFKGKEREGKGDAHVCVAMYVDVCDS